MRKNLVKCMSFALAIALSAVGWNGAVHAKAVAKDPLTPRKAASKNATKSTGTGSKYARCQYNSTANKSKSKKK